MQCGYKDCIKELDPRAVLFGLPEERGLNPRVWYCCAEHALMTRTECYEARPTRARRVSWEG